MQKHVNLVDLVKSFPTNIFLQNLASIQKRTSPVKFSHLDEKSANGWVPNLSTERSTPRSPPPPCSPGAPHCRPAACSGGRASGAGAAGPKVALTSVSSPKIMN